MWKTTDQYSPDTTPNGAMLELLPPWKFNSWPIYGDGVMIASSTTLCAEMDCPQCLAQLAPSGRLTLVEDDPVVVEEVEPEAETEEVVEETPVVKPKSRRRG